MALFKTFYVLKTNSKDERSLKAKTFDMLAVESWEFINDDYTRVIMKSGDKFSIKYPILEFGDMVCSLSDGYGKLFHFNNN